MKPITFKAGDLLFGMLILGAAIVLTSWDFKQTPHPYQHSINDTVPEAKQKKILDLDDVLDELNTVDIKIDMEKAQKELAEAMKKIDAGKLKMQTEMALKEVDMEKMQRELKEAMSKIDTKKMQEELNSAMKQIDAEKIQQQVKAAMESVDLEKMKIELDKVKSINTEKLDQNMKNLQKEMSKLGPEIEEKMQKAKADIEKAKKEIKEYKVFVDGLNADGLIDKKGEYDIKHKDGELIINGKKTSNEVYSKYRSFLEQHKKFHIEKSDDDFNIHRD